MTKKICVFTDSRGQFKLDPAMTMFHEDLGEDYEVTRYAQPHKWTTIPDFLMLVRDGAIIPSQFDYIVLWAGVVDFSPRPFRSCYRELLGGQDRNMVAVVPDRDIFYNRTVNKKIVAIDRMARNRFVDPDYDVKALEWALCPPYAVSYAGEPTASLYSKQFLENIAAELNAIPNLIFIDTCGIHADWDGNFDKGRPRNVGELVRYNNRLTELLNCPIVRQSDWSEDELVTRTIDSMHINQAGSDALRDDLLAILEGDRHADAPKVSNFLLTATDANFFATTLAMIESALDRSAGSVDGIAVLDIGMDKPQRTLLENLRGVHVFDYRDEDRAALAELDVDFFDPKTYGFKVYLSVRAPELIRERLGDVGTLRLMYVDGGILINRDLSGIFRKIAKDGIFCVDHDECRDLYGFRTFLLNVLSPKLIRDGVFDKLSLDQLAKPYIKAGFFGYEVDGPFQSLIDELWDLCRHTPVLTEPKASKDVAERRWFLENTEIEAHAKALHGDGERLILEYVGSRQDQTALSYLVAKHEAPISNSRDYNYTVSTGAGRKAWDQMIARMVNDDPLNPIDRDAFWKAHNEREARKTPANLIPIPTEARSSMTILHRGALVDEDMMKNAGRLMNRARNLKNDTFILLGNGPSLGEVDLKSLEPYSTFGLNAAYRAYERLGFWPTYFGCFDAVVCGHHAEKFKELIKDSPIEQFFFINYNEKKQPNFPEPEIQASPKFANINFVERTVPEKERTDIIAMSYDPFIDMLTSGSNAIQCALLMGYRKIVLLGCDANYVEVVEGASHESNRNRLKMDKTPDANPNYWFADYQQEGDRFNVPNTAGCQLPAWSRLADTISDLGINAEIINCSPISKIDVFKKMPLDEALAYFDKLDVAQIGQERKPSRRAAPLAVSTPSKPEKIAKNKKPGHSSGDGGTVHTDRVPGPVEMLEAMEPKTPAPAPANAALAPVTAAPAKPAPAAPATKPAPAPVPDAATPAPAKPKSSRMGKLRRDPHLFFKDSHSALLRPLRHLFTPTGITPAQAEERRALKQTLGGWRSHLPMSRLNVAYAIAQSEQRQDAALRRVRAEVAQAKARADSLEGHLGTATRKTSEEMRERLAAMRDQISLVQEDLRALNAEEHERHAAFDTLRQEGEAEIAKLKDAGEEVLAAVETKLATKLEAMGAEFDGKIAAQRAETAAKTEAVETRLKTNLTAFGEAEVRRNGVLEMLTKELGATKERLGSAHQTLEQLDKASGLLRQRIAGSERQIGDLRFTDTPQTLVLFGHHKCGSRLFRNEIFTVVAEATGATVHSYQIKDPPFHYSRGEDLDLCNMDFDAIGKNEREVVMFSNATMRSLDRLDRATKDWRGVRVIRDPRQVLVSNYFHHKGDHRDEHNGWVYDQLKKDKPILRELPQDEGLLHELDNISKDIIENQILAPFDDERVLTIKLEDFAADETLWLRRIADFLQVPDIAGVDLERTFANPSSRGWKQCFTSTLRDVFKERYGQALIDLGYAEDMDW